MIPDEAVEAAAQRMFLKQRSEKWADATAHMHNVYRGLAKCALEAAAPHMRQAFFLEMNLRAVEAELKTPLR